MFSKQNSKEQWSNLFSIASHTDLIFKILLSLKKDIIQNVLYVFDL